MKSRWRLRIEFRRSIWIGIVLLLLICLLLCLSYFSKKEPDDIYQSPLITIINPQGETEEIRLEDFMIGVIAAEMPASFDIEALKAQAVAARTYVLSHCPPQGICRHGDAAVCSDPSHCQAYLDNDMLKASWGKNYHTYYDKIEEAVLATQGEVLFWQESIAQAPFFSTCGGRTENAEAVWGKAFPYLVSQECRYCGHSARYSGYQRYSLDEAAAMLAIPVEALTTIKAESYTPGDRIGLMTAGGENYAGTDWRSIFSLNSAAFSWLMIGDYLIFCTVGYGHGVGLCQYGADGMGKNGYHYQEILSHYYPGTSLQEIGSLSTNK
jgi:stage II sporulation protein D